MIKSIDEIELTEEEKKLLKNIRKHNMTTDELKVFTDGLRYRGRKQTKLYDHSRSSSSFVFAMLGDTHFGNKSVNKEALKDFYDLAYKIGVREFYHTGDIVDGLHVHRGQEYELYALGLEQQVADVVNDYPGKKDAVTFFILGNHDLWYYQNAGADIGQRISEARSDLICLGHEEADIIVGKNTKLRLMHPGDGSAYALSYKPQKLVESIASGNKPNILGIGHYHKALFMFYRNVFCYLTGTFEEQTPFMRKKSLPAHIGGWIVEGKSGRNGGVKEINARFIPYMKG